MLDSVFLPLFEITNNPAAHKNLHLLLRNVVGIDVVGDESVPECIQFGPSNPKASDWTSTDNPPYSYYLYYFCANITALNSFRKNRGFNTFSFRPHCGEAGPTEHLISAFLTSESIAHGLKLQESPVMQYLFYLCRIGIAMSPASNNKLFVRYWKNPFHKFFMKGLLVSLSTDDPLQFHLTKDALLEEYAVAQHLWKLSSVDICEIACNSVLQSGFPDEVKSQWIGIRKKDEFSTDFEKTNIPGYRSAYRRGTWTNDVYKLFSLVPATARPAPVTASKSVEV